MIKRKARIAVMLALAAAVAFVLTHSGNGAQAQGGPRYYFDPGWPKTLPNNWKIGGITGLAVVPGADTVWAFNRPNDLTSIELHKEVGIADCCVRPPSMIHFDKEGNVLGSFDAPQGHGMDVDSKGFAYLGQDTVRKYDTRSGKVVAEIPRTPEREGGGGGGPQMWPPKRNPGEGGAGPVAGFVTVPGRGGRGAPDPAAEEKQRQARMAFRKKYPPETPMIVGGLEEIRLDEANNEVYVADNYLGGRVLVFSLDKFEFKRGWGAYGKPLNQISIDDSTRDYKPNGPMAKDFVGHLTLNFSNDGMVYAADRVGNRIHVTDKQGKFIKEFILAPYTGVGGAPGGVSFSPDKEQRYLYISDLTNNHVWFLNRADGKVLGTLGSMGENGGQFFGLHMIATDSRGNIYTGEVFAGERVQRFVPADSPRGKVLQQLEKVPLN
jgi:DNA-binding beta-propeller fold protein YncE